MRQLSKTFTALLVGLFCIFYSFSSSFAQNLKPIARDTSININIFENRDIIPSVDLSKLVNNYQEGFKFEITQNTFTNLCTIDNFTIFYNIDVYRDRDTVTWRVINNQDTLLNDTATIIFNVKNKLVHAVDDSFSILPSGKVGLGIFANDSFLGGDNSLDSSDFRILQKPLHGQMDISIGDYVYGYSPFVNINYTPEFMFLGVDTMIYEICNESLCDTAIVYINVNNGDNTAPIIFDRIETIKYAKTDINITKYIEDADWNINWQSGFKIINTELKGTAKLVVDETIKDIFVVYTPQKGSTAYKDTVSYSVCDLGVPALCDTGSLIINVNDNLPPQVYKKFYLGSYLDSYQFNLYHIDDDLEARFRSIQDPEGDLDLNSFKLVKAPEHFKASLDSMGNLKCFFNEKVSNDSLVFEVCDKRGLCSECTLNFEIYPNDCPIAGNVKYKTTKNRTINNILSAFDRNLNYNKDSILVLKSPNRGSFVWSANGTSNFRFSYIPVNNFIGIDTVIFSLCDTEGLCDTGSIVFEVLDNLPPKANDDKFELKIGGYSITGNIANNDKDVDQGIDPQSVTILNQPNKGNLTINSTGAFTYTSFDKEGIDTIFYIVRDLEGMLDTGKAIFVVWDMPINDYIARGIKTFEYKYTSMDKPVFFDIPKYDTWLQYSLKHKTVCSSNPILILSQQPKNGNIVNLGLGNNTYYPNKNFIGLDTIQILVSYNSDILCADSQSTIVDKFKYVIEVMDTTRGKIFKNTVWENSSFTQYIPFHLDKGNIILHNIIKSPNKGVATFSRSSNIVSYSPEIDSVGKDTFMVEICALNGVCDTSTFYVEIIDVKSLPPKASDDYKLAYINERVVAYIFDNDNTRGNNIISMDIIKQPVNGKSYIEGILLYTDFNLNFLGRDSLLYRICTSSGCDTAMVYFNIEKPIIKHRPVAINDTFRLVENHKIQGSVALNDYDLDNNISFYSAFNYTKHGFLELQSDGTFKYRPSRNFWGIDSISYMLVDSTKLSSLGTLYFIVEQDINPPIAVNEFFHTTKNTAIDNWITLNERYLGVRKVSIYKEPMNGNLQMSAYGEFTYKPYLDYVGIDTAHFIVCNGLELCDTALIIFKVSGSNLYRPDAQNDYFETNENTPLSNTVAQNDTDRNNDLNINSFKVIKSVKNGVLDFKMTGDFTYTPAANFVGQDTVSYSVCDSTGLCDTAMLIIKVNAVKIAYAPDAQNDYFETNENTPLSNTVIKNDSDRNNDLNKNSYVIVKAAKNGNLTLKSNGDFTYTPATNFIGQDTASYSVCDSTGLCDTANLYMTIKKIYHAPTLLEDVFFNTFNNTVRGSVALNDSDSDNDLNSASYQIAVNPKHGNVKIWNDGKFVYLPQYNFVGIDTFLYKACDTRNLCSQGICVIATRGGSLMGKIFVDENKNGLVDTSEVGIANIPVKINGNIMAVTNAKGDYYLPVDTNKTYIVEPIFLSSLFTLDPLSKEVKTGNTFNQVIDNQNFALSPKEPIRDLKIVIEQGEARPGFASNTVITYSNNGTSNLNGSIKLKLDYYLAFNQSDIEPSDIQGNNLTWDFTNLKPFESRRINIINKTSLNSTLGKQMTISYSSILKDAIDADTSNNTGVSLREIRGSYDPNDISVDVENVIQKGTIRESIIPLTYTIRFQNTGNAEAYRVEVVDTLSEKLDIASIEMISASHKFEMKIEPNAPQNQTIVRWIFDNINLMDSTTKEACSHGFVKYRINNDKSKTNYFKDSILNKAAIYFDFNPPVITNTAYTNFLFSTPTSEIQSLGVHAYPNPTSGLIRVELDETISEGNLEVSTLYGQIIQRESFRGGLREIDMSNLAQGVYFIKITSGRKQGTIRVIKQ